jgi:hypothetical protein
MILVALNFLHCCLVTQREKYMVLYRESLRLLLLLSFLSRVNIESRLLSLAYFLSNTLSIAGAISNYTWCEENRLLCILSAMCFSISICATFDIPKKTPLVRIAQYSSFMGHSFLLATR